jgi:acyl-CoA thioester hydrolase
MFIARVALRWSDLDALGHINNTEFLRYLEQARVEFLAEAAAAGVPREVGLLVARHEIDYRVPMPYRREPVEVPTWIDKIGTTSFTFAYCVEVDKVVHARARSVIVCTDGDKPTPVPAQLHRFLAQHAEQLPGREPG